MLLAMAGRRLGVAERLARCFPDRRDPARITPFARRLIRARVFAISCGYEDADDLDRLRTDPVFKLDIEIRRTREFLRHCKLRHVESAVDPRAGVGDETVLRDADIDVAIGVRGETSLLWPV